METIKSKLILNSFDGTMKSMNINPKCTDSQVKFNISYYNKGDILTKAVVIFKGVIAIDFEINYFDNFIGSELFGFYEILENNFKIKMLQKIFNNRIEGYLYHGNYDYNPLEANDMLNYKEPLDEIINQIGKYKLYQQQTQGGIYYVLALGYNICE